MVKLELHKLYELKNGEPIIFDSISLGVYSALDLYTSIEHNGAWNAKGKYLTNVLFLDGQPSEMDVINERR
jgi:hypothetical protein